MCAARVCTHYHVGLLSLKSKQTNKKAKQKQNKNLYLENVSYIWRSNWQVNGIYGSLQELGI